MRKGVEDFVWLLVIAIVILVVFSLISGSVLLPPDEQLSVIDEFSPGVVGFTTELPSQTILLGDLVVGQTQDQFLKGVLEMVVNQGAFGGTSQKFPVAVEDAFLELKKSVVVSFSVLEANPLGNLVITWNGKEFYNSKPSGKTIVEIEKDAIKRTNQIEFVAEGPGIAFWDTTSYTIKNLEIDLEYGPQKIVPFDLLPSDLQSFDRGEVEFFGGGPGTLDVKINGFPIYADTPQGATEIEFDVTYLNAGNNVLSFVSSDSNSISGAFMNIFSFGNQLISKRSFELTEQDVTLIEQERGRIEIEVEEVQKAGSFEVRINGELVESVPLEEGTTTISFSEAEEGENSLEITATGTAVLSVVTIGIAN